ncbi:MAG: Fic family protein [Candidatus Pacearchaeota archaeon]|nr:MAG: Fic family protein [Candidatus Pacearchaeota archaeon]
MVHTEIQEKNKKKYYYRAKAIREGKRVKKERIYLGVNLTREELKRKEKDADKKLNVFSVILTKEETEFLEKIKRDFSKEPKENYENRYEAFCSLFTYDSTGIEGNTLTLSETSYLLFEGIVPKSKSLREINETINHKKAFDYILNYKKDLTKEFILEIHKLVIINALRQDLISQIGRYRTIQVFVGRSIPPKPQDVPREMAKLLRWYGTNKKKLHPLVLASYFHTEFERIHPFVDGNGRVGRLLMNFIMHKSHYPMINIPKKRKFKYYQVLQKMHRTGNLGSFVRFLISMLKKERLRF